MPKKSHSNLKTALAGQIRFLSDLSTERLIIWIIGRSKELNIKLAVEQIVIECWKLNPGKYSMRGYLEFPDSHSVKKRIGEMKGKKGLLRGSEMSGYFLTEISQSIYADLKAMLATGKTESSVKKRKLDRSISSMDEAPYKRLIKCPAYLKFTSGKANEIVETDFLYFYGINWHSKPSIVQNRIKNIDTVVKGFENRDPVLKQVQVLLKKDYEYIQEKLLKGN